MTPDQETVVLEQIDRAAREFEELRSKSQYDDCSDRDRNDVTRVITILAPTIERIAPPASSYRTEARRMLTMWGATNVVCLQYLPGVLAALRSDIEGGFLQSLAELIHADVFSDFLEMAEYLLTESYKEAAAVLAGGVLEERLRKLSIKSGVPVAVGSRPTKADQLNTDLARASVYAVLYQKNITAWLDLRNKAAHGKHTEYSKEQVVSMLSGVQDFAAKFPA